jgi:hypothetical protein
MRLKVPLYQVRGRRQNFDVSLKSVKGTFNKVKHTHLPNSTSCNATTTGTASKKLRKVLTLCSMAISCLCLPATQAEAHVTNLSEGWINVMFYAGNGNQIDELGNYDGWYSNDLTSDPGAPASRTGQHQDPFSGFVRGGACGSSLNSPDYQSPNFCKECLLTGGICTTWPNGKKFCIHE